jgi:O-succinylbenzoic acid--CoA ligase
LKVAFHKEFKLHEKSFSTVDDLIAFSEVISSEASIFLKEWFNKNSFVEVQTSGSTGEPKIIKLQKKHMINSALATATYFNLPQKTKALLCMSPNFIAGKMMLVRALALGWHLDIVAPSANPLKSIDKEYDFSAMVPLQLNSSLNEIHKVKKLIVGGGAISNELTSKIQCIDTEVFSTYGMTETITHIAVKKLNNFQTKSAEAFHYNILPNIKISMDNRGCLVIEAPKIANEIVVTNDLVELISASEFKWLGRYDSVINSGGVKLIPEQIEEKLSEIISQRFFVAGIPDPILGEKLILIVEFKKLEAESLKAEIFNKMQQLQKLNKYEIPKEIFVLDYFIETETNKINRPKTLGLLVEN